MFRVAEKYLLVKKISTYMIATCTCCAHAQHFLEGTRDVFKSLDLLGRVAHGDANAAYEMSEKLGATSTQGSWTFQREI